MKPRDKVQSRIAQEAARLMIEEGIESHHRAKLKAIKRLGLPEAGRQLPRDEAVDSSRMEYLRLFGPSSRTRHVEALRVLALEIMNKLEAFSPRLVGSVAEGTAGRHSPIIIHVFPDAPEDLIKALIDFRIPYREGSHTSVPARDRAAVLPAVTLNHPRSTIDILMFPRELPGKSMGRKADVSTQISCRELQRLLQHDNSES